MGKSSSITDIAKSLNISVTTVSFILNGKAREKRISHALAVKVMKRAKELGYVPNHLAKSLRTGKTNIIGLIVEDISNPFFANVARFIEENADRQGYKIFYCSSENNTEKTRQLIKLFRERQVDGYIITPAPNIEEELKDLLKNQAKVILLDRYLPGIKNSYVVVDNYGGVVTGVRHLIAQGYKKIGFVTLDSDQTQMEDRLNGYRDVIAEHKLKPYIKKIKFHDNPEIVIAEIKRFLSSSQKPDALFFATNYLGISGLEVIKRMGLQVPEQLGVVSFDDHDIFRLSTPSVTAVAQPIEEISKAVITLLLDHLEKDSPKETQSLVLPTNLVVRESSMRSTPS